MDPALEARVRAALEKRNAEGSLRTLSLAGSRTDFYSNDYLGLARSRALHNSIGQSAEFLQGNVLNGSGGSRLLAGNNEQIMDLETELSAFFEMPSALVFGSGYDANLGFFSCVPGRGDTVVHDEFIHASIIDGIRMGFAHRTSFRHNDIDDLVRKIEQAEGPVFIAVESLYSMDGDFATLTEIAQIAEQYSATLYVDEAHSTGITGWGGRGLCNQFRLGDARIIRVHTFGKAFGVHGAVICLPHVLKQYLVNFCRPFIYSTAPAPHAYTAIKQALHMIGNADSSRLQLEANIRLYRKQMGRDLNALPASPIQVFEAAGNSRCMEMAEFVQEGGYEVRAIRSPSVAEGRERIRICIHAFNTAEEIMGLSARLTEATALF